MWIKIWITVFFVALTYGKNFDTCPGYPDGSYIPYCDNGPQGNCQLPDCACAGQEPDVTVACKKTGGLVNLPNKMGIFR